MVVVAFSLGPLLALGNCVPAMAASGVCPAPAADYGKDTLNIQVQTAGTYYVWSHMEVPSSSADSYMLQVDAASCFSVGGGSAIEPGSWTWVDYASGNKAVPITFANLTAGAHTLTMIGSAPGVTVDDILLTTDAACVPTRNGSNCSAAATGTAGVTASVSPTATPADSSATTSVPQASCPTGQVLSAGICQVKAKAMSWTIVGAAVAGGLAVIIGAAVWFVGRRRLREQRNW